MVRAPHTVPVVDRLAPPGTTVTGAVLEDVDRTRMRTRSFLAVRAVTRNAPSNGVVTEIVFTDARLVNVTDVVEEELAVHGDKTSCWTDASAVSSG